VITRRAVCLAALSVVSVACAAEGPAQFGTSLDGGSRPPDARVDTGSPRDLGGRTDVLVAPPDRAVAVDDHPVVSPGDVASVYDTGAGSDACAMGAACTARPDGCEGRERCGNGLDDDCNGMSD
jgi:hypothetical protein